MKVKNKHLITIKKLLSDQKKKFGITESFSYRFDARTKRLILTYTLKKQVKVKGRIKFKRVPVSKYISHINETNYKKYFKGETTIVKDDAIFVRQQNEINDSKYEKGFEEWETKYWVDKYLTRKYGFTKRTKPLSKHTLKSNKQHINKYHTWVIDYDKSSADISSHAENGKKWFLQYYEEQLEKGNWSPTTCNISYRNVKGFYNYISENTDGKFPYNILKHKPYGDAENKRSELSKIEFNKVRDFIVKNQNDVFWSKFVLMLRLQLKTGMRVGELCSIENVNILEKEKTILIDGKTGHRELYFRHQDDEAMWNLVLDKKKEGGGKYLFFRSKIHYERYKKVYYGEVCVDADKPTTSSYYLQRFRQMREKLGLRGKGIITSHSLRRYFIMEYLRQHPDAISRDIVKTIVGHTTDAMLKVYIKNPIQEDTKTSITLGI